MSHVDQPPFFADPLEAQQRYSTGYIQCMQEVHNMLLTCDWMDKTLGSRLLNHLLRSLPRSTEEHAVQPTARNDVPTLVSQGARPQRTTISGEQTSQHVSAVSRRQERVVLHGSRLGTLEMWRPW